MLRNLTALQTELLLQALERDGVLSLGAPESDADYPTFHERVVTMLGLGNAGLMNVTTNPDSMRGDRTYYKASATLTVEGRTQAERLRGRK